ncbi:MAG: XrtA/PEP-CTERM system-associated ATPase [Bdellovibrio bacteriovorus]
MYDSFYGLSGKPFQLTPDQRFYFESQGHHRAMAYLRYGLEQGEGFIVITGGIGTGKTMLVRNLFSELEGREIMAAQLVTTQVEAEDMLRMVCASFGLAHEGMNKATLLHNMEVIARTRFAEGRRILLVVDEAQNLPAQSLEELRMLANFQIEGRSLFQSFLLGQEELRRTLQGPEMEQLRQRIIAAYHLEPLTAQETREYIEFRLRRVDWGEDPVLDPGVFTAIYEHTDGVPRRINTLCDRLLLFGCIEGRHALSTEDVLLVVEELRQEVGRSGPVPQPTPERPVESARVAPAPQEAVATVASAPIPAGDWEQRLAALESEVAQLRATVQKERKLLRKAVLLQLELDAYDDLE